MHPRAWKSITGISGLKIQNLIKTLHWHYQYEIIIVEQEDQNLFNRAKLINVGAKISYLRWQEKCSDVDEVKLCIVSHDIDMLPLNPKLQYTCSQRWSTCFLVCFTWLLNHVIYLIHTFVLLLAVFIWSIFIRAVIGHMTCYNLNWPKIKFWVHYFVFSCALDHILKR